MNEYLCMQNILYIAFRSQLLVSLKFDFKLSTCYLRQRAFETPKFGGCTDILPLKKGVQDNSQTKRKMLSCHNNKNL